MDYKNEMYKGYDRPDDSVEKDGCYKECNFVAGVSVPLEIEPKTNVGEIEIECCGPSAMSMARDNRMPIEVFGLEESGNVTRALLGKSNGTYVGLCDDIFA